jgi:hypothetical protein
LGAVFHFGSVVKSAARRRVLESRLALKSNEQRFRNATAQTGLLLVDGEADRPGIILARNPAEPESVEYGESTPLQVIG